MKYTMFSHFIVVEKKIYASYGIVAKDSSVKLVLKDVSMDKNAVKELVSDLNTQQIKFNNLDTVLTNFFEQ